MATQPTRPRLIKHHVYRSWTSTWRDDSRTKRTARFGKEGEVSRAEAMARWQHWKQTEWDVKEHVRNPGSPLALYTVRKLADDYREHARGTFVKNGENTSTRPADDVDGADARRVKMD